MSAAEARGVEVAELRSLLVHRFAVKDIDPTCDDCARLVARLDDLPDRRGAEILAAGQQMADFLAGLIGDVDEDVEVAIVEMLTQYRALGVGGGEGI